MTDSTEMLVCALLACAAVFVLRQVIRRLLQLVLALMNGCLLWLIILVLVGLYIFQQLTTF
jgi:hypothetical protein